MCRGLARCRARTRRHARLMMGPPERLRAAGKFMAPAAAGIQGMAMIRKGRGRKPGLDYIIS